jgi:1-acyl-sn-glycerol-3-phosphate acyltransferase
MRELSLAERSTQAEQASAPPRRIARGRIQHPTGPARIMRVLVATIFRAVFRIRIEGQEHLPPGPCIFSPNHLGWSDPFLMLVFLPATPRLLILGLHPRVVSAFRAWVVDHLGIMVELDRGRPLDSLHQAREALEAGCSLVVFPEGTYKGAVEGELQRFLPGAAYLSTATGRPLVPVGLTGTHELWLRRPITIRIGPPLRPEAGPGTPYERAGQMNVELREALQALLPGDRAGQAIRRRPLRRWLSTLFD